MDDKPLRGDVRPPSIIADEKATLLAFLNYLRESVASKLVGLSDEEARRPGVDSGTSLAWIVDHLTAVELLWFVETFAGDDPADETATDTPEPIVDLRDRYRRAVERSNELIEACTDLDTPAARPRRHTPQTMRWILVHMIEETARHAGHADILREWIDGSTGR